MRKFDDFTHMFDNVEKLEPLPPIDDLWIFGIKYLRTASGMNRIQFAEYFGFPYRTLQNWELGLRECPEYLLKLIEYKLKKECII